MICAINRHHELSSFPYSVLTNNEMKWCEGENILFTNKIRLIRKKRKYYFVFLTKISSRIILHFHQFLLLSKYHTSLNYLDETDDFDLLLQGLRILFEPPLHATEHSPISTTFHYFSAWMITVSVLQIWPRRLRCVRHHHMQWWISTAKCIHKLKMKYSK